MEEGAWFWMRANGQINKYKTQKCNFIENIAFQHNGTRSEEQKDAAQVESYVAQRYIENPYLLGGNLLTQKSYFTWKKVIQ